ncbi:MAG: AAA family ATPase [Clostridiales bacterium]|nr:AAA family ATPase [Clostridiales bacterium]
MEPFIHTFHGTSWIDRDLEKRLTTSWAFDVNRAGYWIKGLSQIGKTSLLQRFGATNFTRVFIADLSNTDTRERLEFCFSQASMIHSGPGFETRFADKVFKQCFPDFQNTADELIIIDEIQESITIHNYAKFIVRELKAKIAFCGSFMGDLEWQLDLGGESIHFPIGDVACFDAAPVTYREFLSSLSSAEPYNNTLDFLGVKAADHEKEILLSAKKSFDLFFELGGFPKPLSLSETHAIGLSVAQDELFSVLNAQIDRMYEKTKEIKTGNELALDDWRLLVGYITQAVILGKDPEDLSNLKLLPEQEQALGAILDETVVRLINWMVNSCVLAYMRVYDQNRTNSTTSHKLIFASCEMLRCYASLCESVETALAAKSLESEIFVYSELRSLILLSKFKDISLPIRAYVRRDGNALIETAFAFNTKSGARVSLEVKAPSEKGISGSQSLEVTGAEYSITFCEGLGHIHDKAISIPMYHIDRLPAIIDIIDTAHARHVSLEKSYKLHAQLQD